MYAKSAETQKCCAFRQSQQLFAAANAVCYFHQRCKKIVDFKCSCNCRKQNYVCAHIDYAFCRRLNRLNKRVGKTKAVFHHSRIVGCFAVYKRLRGAYYKRRYTAYGKKYNADFCVVVAHCAHGGYQKRYSAAEIKAHYPRCC